MSVRTRSWPATELQVITWTRRLRFRSYTSIALARRGTVTGLWELLMFEQRARTGVRAEVEAAA